VIVAIAGFVGTIYLTVTPGDYERRFSRIKMGMAEKDVQDLMGSEGNSTYAKYIITGDNRQRVWVIKERGQQIVFVVVFDASSRVVAKELYKSSQIINYMFKDM
jgi:hypothetical protein